MEHLQKLLSEPWAINAAESRAFMAIIAPCLLAGKIEEAESLISKSNIVMSAATPTPTATSWWGLDDIDLPDGSVAVFRLSGFLYSWTTDQLINGIKLAEANPRIAGIVIVIDGPGGMSARLDQAAAAIRACTKPTATVVEGCMASAYMWIGTATDRTFIASRSCEIGSVGVMSSYMGYKKYFEMQGIDFREIYPDSADLKNREIRNIEESGDDTLIKERAGRLHKMFAEAIAEHLGIKYDPEDPFFRGEMFMAEDAVKAGYIDQFGVIDDAMAWVVGRAAAEKANRMF